MFIARFHWFSLKLHQQLVLCLLALVILGVITLWAMPHLIRSNARIPSVSAVVQATPAPLAKSEYVQSHRLRWDLRNQLQILGDRLAKPGKERITMTGTVTRPNVKADKVPVRLIVELPDKIRLQELTGNKAGVTVFDGTDLKSSRPVLDKSDENEIESLVFDATDHFFLNQMQGVATRWLGNSFRLDDGRTPGYTGPSYDLFQTGETIVLKKEAVRQQLKQYYFNSKTQLLERIRYSFPQPNGKPTAIEILISGWKQFDGQYLPTSLQRNEDGSPVFVLTIESVAIGQKQADGIFTNL